MNKSIRVLIMFLVMSIMLFGCSKEKPMNVDATNSADGLVDTGIMSTKGPNTTEKPQPVILGEGMNLNDSVKAINSKVSQDGFTLGSTFFFDEERLLVIQYDENNQSMIGVYNIYTGTYEKEKIIPYYFYIERCTICENGDILFRAGWGREFVYLDSELNEICDYSCIEENYTSIVVDRAGDTLYYIDETYKNIYELRARDKSSVPYIQLAEEMDLVTLDSVTNDGQFLVASYCMEDGESGNLSISLAEKKVSYLKGLESSFTASGNIFYMNDYSDDSKGYFKSCEILNPRVVQLFYFNDAKESNCFQLDGEKKKILSIASFSDEEENPIAATLQLYDYESSRLLQSASIEKTKLLEYAKSSETNQDLEDFYYFYGYNGISIAPDCKTAVVTYCLNGKNGILLWNLTCEKEQVVETEEVFSFSDTADLARENDAQVERINKEYGVTIYIREAAIRFFPDFAVTELEDEELIQESLVEVEKVLSKFPKGFFEEFHYGDIDGVEIYLCERLIQGYEYGIAYPAGYALEFRNKSMVVLDATLPGSLKTTFSHELMHVIDNRISYRVYMENSLSDSIYTKWDKLNPKGHNYPYAYVDEEGIEFDSSNHSEYTPGDEKSEENVNNIYFVDYYANTYPTEDRARIFETLMTYDEELPSSFQSEHLRKKALYLCEMIRKGMEGIEEDSKEVFYWERLLKQE